MARLSASLAEAEESLAKAREDLAQKSTELNQARQESGQLRGALSTQRDAGERAASLHHSAQTALNEEFKKAHNLVLAGQAEEASR